MLAAFIDQAFADHASAPEAVAARLPEGFALLAAAPDQAESFARLTEHVVLGHLDDTAQLESWLDRLEPLAASNAGLGLALARARLAGALATGRRDPDASLPSAERVRAHGNALLALTRRSAWTEIRALLDEARGLIEDAAGQRVFAAITNNLAGDLRFYHAAHRADAAYAALMIDAARLAREHWHAVGGWLEQERADYQLALCLASTGAGEEALFYARSCWQRCRDNRADDDECCYALEALGHAQHAAGLQQDLAETRALMAEYQSRLDEGSRRYTAPLLAALDALLSGKP
jgi:hypothetical protein